MNGYLIHDTLRMSYLKDNIAFYVADGVPYFRQSYREYEVVGLNWTGSMQV